MRRDRSWGSDAACCAAVAAFSSGTRPDMNDSHTRGHRSRSVSAWAARVRIIVSDIPSRTARSAAAARTAMSRRSRRTALTVRSRGSTPGRIEGRIGPDPWIWAGCGIPQQRRDSRVLLRDQHPAADRHILERERRRGVRLAARFESGDGLAHQVIVRLEYVGRVHETERVTVPRQRLGCGGR